LRRRAADTLLVAVLGVGEAGACLAEGLVAAGAEVRAWDPRPETRALPLTFADDPADAAAGADVVLSVNSAASALEAAEAAVPALRAGTIYADLNTAAAGVKVALAQLVGPTGALFADVALVAPVPLHGLRTPALASGPGADELARTLGALGMPIEVIDGPPGAAATRKLLRSVFMKGLAACMIESLRAAEAAGCAPWLRRDIAAALAGPGEPLVERLLTGSVRHATRRRLELDAAAELLRELGVEPRMTVGAGDWLAELEADPDTARIGLL
jgi:3-hydroxyisobutyrate dehydrogenase-like beta-hydroxyacid dehydrogenase